MRIERLEFQVIDSFGTLTKEIIKNTDIEKFIAKRIVSQSKNHTWINEDVRLKDGRQVTIRTIWRNNELPDKA